MSPDWPLILAYHHIALAAQSRYVVTQANLEAQLEHILAMGFSAMSLEEALASGAFGSDNARAKTFTLTFDDGLESFRTLAFPVLARLGLLGATTVFVPTAFVGAENTWRTEPTRLQRLMPWSDPAEALMMWDQLREIAEAGVSVQSHGHGHLAMQDLSYDAALDDARTSMALLGEHGFRARYFALPYGWHSEDCKRAIRDAGFDAALSVKWGGQDRYEVRRIPVYGTDSGLTTRLKLSGRYFDAFDFAARLAGKSRYRR